MRIPVESATSYRGRNARPNWLTLAAFIAAALGSGALGALFSPAVSAAANHWYALLAKPGWAPPNNWFASIQRLNRRCRRRIPRWCAASSSEPPASFFWFRGRPAL